MKNERPLGERLVALRSQHGSVLERLTAEAKDVVASHETGSVTATWHFKDGVCRKVEVSKHIFETALTETEPPPEEEG